jgi:nucleoid-associated protein YgaU
MGIFDSIKNAFGGGDEPKKGTAGPSQLLREAGLDPQGLKFGFGTGTITVSGAIADEADRAKIVEVLEGIEGISKVEDRMTVAVPAPPAPEPEAAAPAETPAPAEAAAPAESEAPADSGRTYTVQSGDSLWKIAEEMYGSGAKYKHIFEANRDLLDDPDRIFPGQVLKIPDLD